MSEVSDKPLLLNNAVDCVIFGFQDSEIFVLLINRSDKFIDSKWALPGALIFQDESLEEAASRILHEMSGMQHVYMNYVKPFSKPDRAPVRTITFPFFALVDISKYELKKSDNLKVKEAKWFAVTEIPDLPLDHKEIAFEALMEMKSKFRYEPMGYELLPKKFTLLQLQQLYEAIYDVKVDKGNFRKKMLNIGHLVELDEFQENANHRKAKLFKFDFDCYQALLEKGIYIDIIPKNLAVN